MEADGGGDLSEPFGGCGGCVITEEDDLSGVAVGNEEMVAGADDGGGIGDGTELAGGASGGEVESGLGREDETVAVEKDAADGPIDEREVEGGGLVGGRIDVAPDLDFSRGGEDGGDIVAGLGEEDIAGFLGQVEASGGGGIEAAEEFD